MVMELFYLVLLLAVAGFMVYLVVTYIPMPEPFKQVIVVLTVILLLLFVVAKLLPRLGIT